MCIIIDTNTLSSVFKNDDAQHHVFEPVKRWIMEGKGKVVYGGSKYISELGPNYVRLFSLLRGAGKAVFVPNDIVDSDMNVVSAQITHDNFDDQHIVALLRVSGCKLICSSDRRAYPFFRHNLFFNPARNKPKIYSSLGNTSLLVDRNIADVCLPCSPTTNAQRVVIGTV
ncbi:hypothetical protein [Spirosoma flavum]|uniref:PIN domain-containing protein n=1 Tax=Spirosoma flavum TaxID=2048557 RepID=A0ABW6AVX8_9BACT